jgi:nucleoside transporter
MESNSRSGLSLYSDRRVILLSIMMFLELCIWGAWFITIGSFLGARPALGDATILGNSVRAWAYSVGPIAAIISPLFLGVVADRFFASEKVLATMSLLGGVAMLGVAFVAQADGGSGAYKWSFITLLLLHNLCYFPTLGLVNTVSFHHLSSPEKQFPFIRVFGTIGWIVASGLIVSKMLKADTTIAQFYVSAGAAIALGIFSFFLPHTPAPAKGQKVSVREILGLDAIALMKSPAFAVFIIGSLLTCIPLNAYFVYAQSFVGAAGFKDPAFAMSFGQVAEIFFMISMPLFFAYLGVKWMMLVGMLAWFVRFALFAAGAPGAVAWMIVLGILLHGICYDFFFVTGFIYADKRVNKDMRGKVQGLLVLVTQGLGMFFGAQIAGKLGTSFLKGTGAELLKSYQKLWLVPAAMAAVVFVVFLVFFKDDAKTAVVEESRALPTGKIACPRCRWIAEPSATFCPKCGYQFAEREQILTK